MDYDYTTSTKDKGTGKPYAAREGRKSVAKSKESHERYFSKKARQLSVLKTGDLVYIDKASCLKKRNTNAGTPKFSRKLVPRKVKPFRVRQLKNHTITVDVNGM